MNQLLQGLLGMTPPQQQPMAPAQPQPSGPQSIFSNPAFSDALFRMSGALANVASQGGGLAQGLAAGGQAFGSTFKEQAAAQAAAQQQELKNALALADVQAKLMNADTNRMKAERPELTVLQQNLMAAGINPNSPQGQQIILQAILKPQTQISMGGDRFANMVASENIKRAFGQSDELTKDIMSLRTERDNLQQLLDLVPQTKTGFGQETVAKAANIFKSLGFEVNESQLANQDLFLSTVGEKVLQRMGQIGGNDTKEEREFVQALGGSLGATPLSNATRALAAMNLLDRRIVRQTRASELLEESAQSGQPLSRAAAARRAAEEVDAEIPLSSLEQIKSQAKTLVGSSGGGSGGSNAVNADFIWDPKTGRQPAR